MFKRILLPTDGSELSLKAVIQGIRLAKSIGAEIVGLNVMPQQHTFFFNAKISKEALEVVSRDFEEQAQMNLSVIEKAAAEAGVKCELVYERDDSPYQAIIRVAMLKSCDLIMMASHGRRGIEGILLGSETQKVLTHSKTPVLVYR
jgi:nucleotide-binding universal stress UspA family protein